MKRTTAMRQMSAYMATLATYRRAPAQGERRGSLSEDARKEAARDLRRARGASKWAPSKDLLPGARDPRRRWRNATIMAHKDRSAK